MDCTRRHPTLRPGKIHELSVLSLCCVVAGRGRLTAGPEELPCEATSGAILVRPGPDPAVLAPDDAGCLAFALPIDPATVTDLYPALGMATPDDDEAIARTCRTALTADLAEVTARFLDAVADPGDERVLAPCYALELAYRLLRADCGAWLVAAALQTVHIDPIHVATRHIEENIDRQIAVDELAGVAGMSTRAFRIAFTEATGVGPARFVKNARLDRARALLLESHLNVAEVAAAVGYLSRSKFITAFRERFGSSPRAYQESWRRVALSTRNEIAPRCARE